MHKKISLAVFLFAMGASAKEEEEVHLPSPLTLDASVATFRAHGFDVLLADAAQHAAEGDVKSAAHVANPVLYGAVGPSLYESTCAGCSRLQINAGLSDGGTIFDLLAGKRGARHEVASQALEAIKQNRADVARSLEREIKARFVSVVFSRARADVAVDVQKIAGQALDVATRRHPGTIDDGAFARVETEKLSADSRSDIAKLNILVAKSALGVALGVRGLVPPFECDTALLTFSVPAPLAAPDETKLIDRAYAVRPDLKRMLASYSRADASVTYAERSRFPYVELGAFLSMQGTTSSAISPPVVYGSVTVGLPLFYQAQGQIETANADVMLQTVSIERVKLLIAIEVRSALAGFSTAKTLAERMVPIAERADRARAVIDLQFQAGSVALSDLLDAQRTLARTKVDFYNALEAYWNAVFEVERAIGEEVQK